MDLTPPGPYKPATVNDCLFQAYNFERDFHMRKEPPFPHAAVRAAGDVNQRRQITKRYNSRVKRANTTEAQQRTVKWQGLVRRANRAATQGRVPKLFLLI